MNFTANEDLMKENLMLSPYYCLDRANNTVYYYRGSMTSPDKECSENVNWVLFAEIQQMNY